MRVLNATLRELAREGHALGISRQVWVDRAMRAWSIAETAAGTPVATSVGD